MTQFIARSITRSASLTLTLCAALPACGGDTGMTAMPSTDAKAGIAVLDQSAVLRTEVFTLEPESETYLCYATEVPEDLVIDGFSVEGAPHLHHLLFSRSSGEPDGLTECDVVFRYTWQPLFASGAGASELAFPEDTGHRIDAGEQLVLQMHLFNPTPDSVTGSVELTMHRSSSREPEVVGNKTFGSFELNLPPSQSSEVEALCTIEEPVEILAVFPHMHMLGTSLTFEVGSSEDSMQMVFERDPFDFDDQRIEPLELTLQPGDMTRLRCHYDNPHDREVGFGESTNDEMCFLMGFTRGEHGIGGCTLRGQDGGFQPMSCADVEPNERGVGESCTADGDECAEGLRCSASLSADVTEGTCIALGCASTEECGGGGATCCTPSLGGGVINICMPEACRPDDCEPVE